MKLKETFNKRFKQLKDMAKKMKREVLVLYLAYKRPETPWYAKLLSIIVAGYALSPIDLIPDFIPVLGYLDDLILIPVGVYFAIKLIPENVLTECRLQADEKFKAGKPVNWTAGFIIILIWALIAAAILIKLFCHK